MERFIHHAMKMGHFTKKMVDLSIVMLNYQRVCFMARYCHTIQMVDYSPNNIPMVDSE